MGCEEMALGVGLLLSRGGSRELFYLDPPILHQADIAFEADRAGGWNFQRSLQHLAVAGAVRNAIPHRDFNFVPVLCAVFFSVLYLSGPATGSRGTGAGACG